MDIAYYITLVLFGLVIGSLIGTYVGKRTSKEVCGKLIVDTNDSDIDHIGLYLSIDEGAFDDLRVAKNFVTFKIERIDSQKKHTI